MSEFTLIHFSLCCFFFGIGFLAASWLRVPVSNPEQNDEALPKTGKPQAELPDAPSQIAAENTTTQAESETDRDIQEVVLRVQTLADGMRTDVHHHTQSVEQINLDLGMISHVSDPEAVTRVISRLMEANRHLDSRLNVAEARLREQSQLLSSQRVEARTDALTGLPNRRVFDEETERLFREKKESKRPASMIMIDIDHFKEFNDQYGHQAGDICLTKVGEVIRQTVRGIGGIVVRYGGEEFAVLIPGTEIFDAKIATQRLIRHIEALKIDCEGLPLSVTASMGVAEISNDADTSQWIGRADRALYAAKRRGRNRACWHDGKTFHEVRVAKEPGDHSEESMALGKREAFTEDMDRRLALFHRKRQPLALVLASIDLIDSKPAEEHLELPTLQKAVMQVFESILRDMDHICQMGDNQFGALLPAATGGDAAIVAERAREAVNRLVLSNSRGEIRFTISCGVSEALEGDEVEHMVSRSETGMRHARQQGGNVVYQVRHEFDWESPLRITNEDVIAE